MKPVIIFDLDDTLILQDLITRRSVDFCTAFLGLDPERFWQTFQEASQKAFKNLSSYSWCQSIGISAQEGLWGNFGGAAPELNDLRRDVSGYRFNAWSTALASFGFSDPDLARSISEDFASLRGRRYYAFPDAARVLRTLAPEYELAILTNGAPELQWSKVHACGLEPFFSSITVSGDYGIGKPDPRLFDVVRAKHPGSKSFLMVGNSPHSDIRGAHNAQMPCVWFVQGDEPPDAGVHPDGTIRSLSELPGLLKTLIF
jgi:putative hydrolase of the HAD superfamily